MPASARMPAARQDVSNSKDASNSRMPETARTPATARMTVTARMPATRKDASKNYVSIYRKTIVITAIPARNVIGLKQQKNQLMDRFSANNGTWTGHVNIKLNKLKNLPSNFRS
jgi:hypothetical protein